MKHKELDIYPCREKICLCKFLKYFDGSFAKKLYIIGVYNGSVQLKSIPCSCGL